MGSYSLISGPFRLMRLKTSPVLIARKSQRSAKYRVTLATSRTKKLRPEKIYKNPPMASPEKTIAYIFSKEGTYFKSFQQAAPERTTTKNSVRLDVTAAPL